MQENYTMVCHDVSCKYNSCNRCIHMPIQLDENHRCMTMESKTDCKNCKWGSIMSAEEFSKMFSGNIQVNTVCDVTRCMRGHVTKINNVCQQYEEKDV